MRSHSTWAVKRMLRMEDMDKDMHMHMHMHMPMPMPMHTRLRHNMCMIMYMFECTCSTPLSRDLVGIAWVRQLQNVVIRHACPTKAVAINPSTRAGDLRHDRSSPTHLRVSEVLRKWLSG